MKILTVTTLFPNNAQPNHGIFVENRLRDYCARYESEIRVIAPVPWFPARSDRFGKYAQFARAHRTEQRAPFTISHPRYVIPPKIGMTYAAHSLTRAVKREASTIAADGFDCDLVDGHYLYPDGVAAAALARHLDKPLILTARGSDVSQIAHYPRQRRMIMNAIAQAESVICVAGALRDELIKLGAPSHKITVLRNGVDLEQFRPLDRTRLRAALNLKGPVIGSVGHLIERKGHDRIIAALTAIPDATLLIVGAGEEDARLRHQAEKLGLGERVRFMGAIGHDQMAQIYNAMDVLALGSSREGWPNVLLEAMACGTPAVAAPIWGCGEVISDAAAGQLAASRDPADFAAALKAVMGSRLTRADTRAFAEGFSWEATSRGMNTVFSNALKAQARRRAIKQKRISWSPPRQKILLTVDTEEAFDWRANGSDGYWLTSPSDLDAFQAICDARGIRPLYFLTYPLISNAKSAQYFRTLSDEGRADLGLHLHPWTTPPESEFRDQYYSWQSNLPFDVQLEKLKTLAGIFEETFGKPAIAHRAGRYGIDLDSYGALAKIGIRHDFSPSPCFDFSHHGGPDFSGMANTPFIVETPQSKISVTPVCGSRTVRGTRIFIRTADRNAVGYPQDPMRAMRHKLTAPLTAPLRLSCEQSSLSDLKQLTRKFRLAETPILVFSFHSTSMTVGANPYARTQGAVTGMLDLISDYLDYVVQDLGIEPVSLAGLDELYALNAPTPTSRRPFSVTGEVANDWR